jgi:hypothetical protein
MMLIIQIEDQVDQQHHEYMRTFYQISKTLFFLNIFQKDEPSSSKKSTLSPVDGYRHHSSSKYETTSHRPRRGSSKTLSPSPSRSRHSTTNGNRSKTKNSSSPKVYFIFFLFYLDRIFIILER